MSFVDPHFAEHPRFHVKQQMAVVSPPTECIGRDTVGALRARRHVDRVLAHVKPAGIVLEVTPHSVQMDGMGHHRVVHEHDAEAFAVGEANRLRVGELDTVE